MRRDLAGAILTWAVLAVAGGGPVFGAASSPPDSLNKQVHVVKIADDRLRVWIPDTPTDWVRFEMRRYKNAGIQLDAWRLNTVYTFSTPSPIDSVNFSLMERSPSLAWTTQGSNFEYAIRLAGRPDFFGGQHGDELLQSIAFRSDSHPVDFVGDLRSGNVIKSRRFEIVQHTAMFDPANPSQKAGDMHTRYTFSAEGLHLEWDFTWQGDYAVSLAYGAMFPATRGPQTAAGFRFIGDETVYDISHPRHKAPGTNSPGLRIFSKENDWQFSLEIDDRFFNGYKYANGRGLWVYDGEAYNKVYSTRVYSPLTEHVRAGDTWSLSATYRLSRQGSAAFPPAPGN